MHDNSMPGTRVSPTGSAARASATPAWRVVVRQGEDIQLRRESAADHLSRCVGTVRGAAVNMQVDAHPGHATSAEWPGLGSYVRPTGVRQI